MKQIRNFASWNEEVLIPLVRELRGYLGDEIDNISWFRRMQFKQCRAWLLNIADKHCKEEIFVAIFDLALSGAFQERCKAGFYFAAEFTAHVRR